jgi:glycosyltransferase involved in cell wall biosynthesis
LYPRKNVPALLSAFTRVARAVPDTTLHIIGSGLQLRLIRKMARDHPAQERVFVHGEVAREKLPKYFHQATVFCLPSLHETFGLVYLEAMTAGLPVVALNRTAVPELVRNGQTGLLLEQDSETSLADALIRLLMNPEEAEQMGREGQKTAASFSWKKCARSYRELLHRFC